MNILKVVNVSPIKGNTNNNGENQTLTLQEYKVLGVNGGILVPTVKRATRTLFRGVKNKDGNTITTKDQVLFGTLQVGDVVSGVIETVDTTQYKIDGKTVSSFTTVIFEGENGLNVINSQLKAKGAVMKDDDGNLTAELPQTATNS